MLRTRRRFLEQLAGGALVSAAAPSSARAAPSGERSRQPGAGRYDYLGSHAGAIATGRSCRVA